MALAERGDERIVEPLIDVFTNGSVGTLEVRAAAKLADLRLHPALLATTEWWGDSDREILERALHRCDPHLRARATAEERELLNPRTATRRVGDRVWGHRRSLAGAPTPIW